MVYESFKKKHLPYATAIFTLGLLGVLLSFSIGFLLGAAAFLLADRPRRLYRLYPDIYIDYGSVSAGRLMGLIALILNFLIFAVLLGIIYGGVVEPAEIQEWATSFATDSAADQAPQPGANAAPADTGYTPGEYSYPDTAEADTSLGL
jgi:hypothetical protein